MQYSGAAHDITHDEGITSQCLEGRADELFTTFKTNADRLLSELGASDTKWLSDIRAGLQKQTTLREALGKVSTLRRVLLEEKLRWVALRVERLVMVSGKKHPDLTLGCEELREQLRIVDTTGKTIFGVGKMTASDKECGDTLEALETRRDALRHCLSELFIAQHTTLVEERALHRRLEKARAEGRALEDEITRHRAVARETENTAVQQCDIETNAVEAALKAEIASTSAAKIKLESRLRRLRAMHSRGEERLEHKVTTRNAHVQRENMRGKLQLQGLYADMDLMRKNIRRIEANT
eukprot:PhM_4_TR7449/c0_g1_i1/m.10089